MRLYDSMINEIHEALLNDDRTAQAPIRVFNDQGIVTLMGEVDSLEIAIAAEDIVSQQLGVLDVVNALRIK